MPPDDSGEAGWIRKAFGGDALTTRLLRCRCRRDQAGRGAAKGKSAVGEVPNRWPARLDEAHRHRTRRRLIEAEVQGLREECRGGKEQRGGRRGGRRYRVTPRQHELTAAGIYPGKGSAAGVVGALSSL